MADPDAPAPKDPFSGHEHMAPVSRPVFEPRPPEALPEEWSVSQAAVSRAPLRRRRGGRVLPLLFGLAVTVSVAGVGHHWYQRQQMAQQEAQSDQAEPPSDMPYSLRAAWRDVSRKSGSTVPEARMVSPDASTSVISVLDDPIETAREAPPRRESRPDRPPTPAELLAERMATAAASDSAAAPSPPPVAPEKPAPTAGRTPTVRVPGPATLPVVTPPATAHVPAAATDPVVAKRPEISRAPGMVGLGGPPAPREPDRRKPVTEEHETAKPRVPQRRTTHSSPAPASSERRQAQAHPRTTAPARLRPRKPLSRKTGVTSEQADSQPSDLPTIFKRIERRMP